MHRVRIHFWTNASASTLRGLGLARCWRLLCLLVAGTFGAMAAQAQTIDTVAGTGVQGFSGDGGLATSARLNFSYGLAVDGAGNLYISDSSNHRIRRVDASGIITTVAGTGTAGYGGDGGPAVAAQLNEPRGIAVDTAGNLYIADLNNHRIRRVGTGGTITTVAGTGAAGYGGDGGPATAARLNSPFGVAVDGSGRLHIADSANYRIRRVETNGTIATEAGTGTSGYAGDNGPALAAQFRFIFGIAHDSRGNLYLADGNNHRVRRVAANGTMTTVAGVGISGSSGDGGAATAAQLNFPTGMAIDTAGMLYIADAANNRVRQVTTGGTITTLAGSGASGYGGDGGPASAARLQFPFAVVLASRSRLQVADSANFRTRLVSLAIVPDPPTGLTATAGSGQATLAWMAPAYGGSSAITGYTVTGVPIAGGASLTCTAVAPATQCTAAGLVDGAAYRFTVRAGNNAGDSVASSSVQVASFSAVPGVPGSGGVVVSGAGSGCAWVPAPTGFGTGAPAGLPAGSVLPAGVFRLRALGCAGATLTVAVSYPQALPAAASLYQYGPAQAGQAAAWSAVAGAVWSPDRRTVTYAMADDGTGDLDTTTAGAIQSLVAPLVLAAGGAQAIPAWDRWALWLTILLTVAMGLARLRRPGD